LKPAIKRLSRADLWAILPIAVPLCFVQISALAEAKDGENKSESTFEKILGAVTGGKPILDVRFRWEYAKINTFQHSHAATVRTRFGYQTKPVFGVSGLLEGVNTASPKPSGYYDGVETNMSQSLLADATRTNINRV
jgi:hypothetical protein